MKLFSNFILLLVFMLIIISCNKNVEMPQTPKIAKDCVIETLLANSNNPLDDIGVRHNSSITRIIDSLVNNDLAIPDTTGEWQLFVRYLQIDTNYITSHLIDSVQATTFIDSIRNRAPYMDSIYQRIGAVNSSAMSLENRINAYKYYENHPPSFNNGVDSVLYFSGLAVIKYSSYLWYPTDDCGLGYLDRLHTAMGGFRNNILTKRTPGWLKILTADAYGAWGGSIVGAVKCIAGGPEGMALGATLGAVGGAIGGSMTSGLSSF